MFEPLSKRICGGKPKSMLIRPIILFFKINNVLNFRKTKAAPGIGSEVEGHCHLETQQEEHSETVDLTLIYSPQYQYLNTNHNSVHLYSNFETYNFFYFKIK